MVLLYFSTSRSFQKIRNKLRLLAYAAMALFAGMLIEWLQHAMHLGRTGDLLDALANAAGILFGLVFSRIIHRILA